MVIGYRLLVIESLEFRVENTEFDVIYVNGNNTLPNMRRDEEHWKVVLTEEEFAKRMFEEGYFWPFLKNIFGHFLKLFLAIS